MSNILWQREKEKRQEILKNSERSRENKEEAIKRNPHENKRKIQGKQEIKIWIWNWPSTYVQG